ncbi:NAD-dependent DNA ligase LigA [Bianquea renquensis]|jgi:DNA ligase (NAD+)|uniref:DNA ligase n=1 Tax=Bianquea renquensis TaxID=2763661 RepID=A0A926DRR9_9FIRM|nr:NAD-dependent DNA ligase LigA [Bianquea renquensis]MBC8542833.1 NAD-dependent DNA ligase LigA [Bianquea renquensis]
MAEDTIEKLKKLTKRLNDAAEAYYQQDREIMTNFEYDALYDELVALERETGMVLSESPTRHVGYQIQSSLPKVSHSTPMLSLDKTKSPGALRDWLGSQTGLLSWKLDGLTIVLQYDQGALTRAVTRGNGEVGEDITPNAKVFRNIPLEIPYKGELILRGEAVISYGEFTRINEALPPEEQYKNPRNLCSGSVRQLNNEITAKRGVHYFVFGLVLAQDMDFHDSKEEMMTFIQSLGFETVEFCKVDAQTVEEAVQSFEGRIAESEFPSDGLVLTFNSISYSESLGRTAKFPRDSIAFKWQDETRSTVLRDIEWNTSRTGLINPVAIFDPVELEGTTVQRASIHNISIMEELELGIGDEIEVYKANMIIPQIGENLTRSGTAVIPEYCPRCGGAAKVSDGREAKVLYCTNPNCGAKLLMAFTHFTTRNAMNIEGLSEATLEKFIDMGFLESFGDIYRLKEHKADIESMEGFGERSAQNLFASIERSRDAEMPRFINALGIQNVGLANARLLCKAYRQDLTAILAAKEEELASIDGFGDIIANRVYEYFQNPINRDVVEDLLRYVRFAPAEESEEAAQMPLEGKTFVITGNLEHFENRDALVDFIIKRGGKAVASVSKKTSYLINNDTASSSSKNKKAQELGIPILSEEEFLRLVEDEI